MMCENQSSGKHKYVSMNEIVHFMSKYDSKHLSDDGTGSATDWSKM